MYKEMDDLEVQVSANTDAERAAIVLIQGLANQIANAANDPVRTRALATNLKDSADALAAAIVANTPADPGPPSPPVPPTV